ncbi:unnamed protein product [Soboliphyme baturini]|uniref:Uncharacterized protein n=1 Tax=Soboliphyme baturini TaxID=241478 RepID=A0A183JA50_9BILA|nr:unnamed protein product [Soboliphyme baturini]
MVLRFMTGNAEDDNNLNIPRIAISPSSASDDVITTNSIHSLMNNPFDYRTRVPCPMHAYDKKPSAFSACLGKARKLSSTDRRMLKYTVRRSPGRIEHLVSNESFESNSLEERLGLDTSLSPQFTYAVYDKSISITSTV